MKFKEITRQAFEVFSNDVASPPTITLRGGDALDDYEQPPRFDEEIDAITDEYILKYVWGIGYLDSVSARHYLPHLIEFSERHYELGSLVIDALLNSLRPPDREPPRLATFSADQKALIAKFIELLSFSPESAHQDLACQVLEEWWVSEALC